jgi:hypothetical protein
MNISALKLNNSLIISSMCAMIYRPIGKRQDGGEQQGVWIGDIVTLIGATTKCCFSVKLCINNASL